MVYFNHKKERGESKVQFKLIQRFFLQLKKERLK